MGAWKRGTVVCVRWRALGSGRGGFEKQRRVREVLLQKRPCLWSAAWLPVRPVDL